MQQQQKDRDAEPGRHFSPTFECEGKMDKERHVANTFFWGGGGGAVSSHTLGRQNPDKEERCSVVWIFVFIRERTLFLDSDQYGSLPCLALHVFFGLGLIQALSVTFGSSIVYRIVL